MRKSFFANTAILAAAFQILRVFGIFLIAFLSSKIGTEGIGLYQLIFSLYFLAATLVTSGIGTAVTRLTAESLGKSGYRSTSNVLRKCIIYSLVISALVAALLYISAGFLGSTLLGDSRTIVSIQMMAPSLPFMAIVSCLRSYFYGVRKVLEPASIMIFEQIIQFAMIIALLNIFVPKGLEYACFAVIIACSAAEAITCGYSYILYRIQKHKSKLAVIKDSRIGRKILSIALPVAGSSYLRSGLKTAESILIPSRLEMSGASNKSALSQYGLLIGMVMPILFFPTAILFAVSTLLLPEVSEAHALDNREKVNFTVSRVLQLTLLFSLLFFGIYTFFSSELCMAIYQNVQAGNLLRILAPLVPLMYLDILVDGILNGLNQQVPTMIINISDYTLRIILLLIFVPKYGLGAYIVIFFISTILNAFLSLNRLVRVTRIKIELANWVVKPLLSIIASGLLVTVAFNLIPAGTFTPGFNLALKILLAAILYLGLLVWLECITQKDMAVFKHLVRGPKRYQE